MNSSSNGSEFGNATNPFFEDAPSFIASGVAHFILVVIPALVLGPILLSLLLSNKKLRDPPSILFICTTVLCIVGSVTYGLLMDLSLITDLPFLGACDSYSQESYWHLSLLFHGQLFVSTAYLTIVQYITIRWGPKKLSTTKTVVIFFILGFYTFFFANLNLVYFMTVGSVVPVRGSLCFYPFEVELLPFLVSGFMVLVCFFIPSVTIVIVFSVLSFRYVKKHTINNVDVTVVKSVLKIMIIVTVSTVVFRVLPTINIFFALPYSIDWLLTYTIELNFPLFLFLTIFVHKSIRQALLKHLKCSSIKRLFGKPSNQVSQTTTHT